MVSVFCFLYHCFFFRGIGGLGYAGISSFSWGSDKEEAWWVLLVSFAQWWWWWKRLPTSDANSETNSSSRRCWGVLNPARSPSTVQIQSRKRQWTKLGEAPWNWCSVSGSYVRRKRMPRWTPPFSQKWVKHICGTLLFSTKFLLPWWLQLHPFHILSAESRRSEQYSVPFRK